MALYPFKATRSASSANGFCERLHGQKAVRAGRDLNVDYETVLIQVPTFVKAIYSSSFLEMKKALTVSPSGLFLQL